MSCYCIGELISTNCPEHGSAYQMKATIDSLRAALQMIATGKGTGCTEAENAGVMRSIAQDALAQSNDTPD